MFHQVVPVVRPRQSCCIRRPCGEMTFGRPQPLWSFVVPVQARENYSVLLNQFMDTLRQSPGLRLRNGDCCAESSDRKRKSIDSILAELDFREFSPEEIKVKITEKNILVHGVHQDESSFYEIRRSVPLPKDILKRDIVCRYENGRVKLELQNGRSGKQKKLTVSTTNAIEDKREDIQKEECELSQEKEAFEKFKNNFNDVNSMFFGLPFFQLIERENENANEDKNEDKEESKKEMMKTEQENEEQDSEVGEKVEKAEDSSKEQEQTCVLDKCSEPELNCDDFVHASPMSSDSVQAEELTTDESTMPVVHTAEVAPAHPDFKVEVDISKFEPDDIRVVVSDRQVMVSGEREVKGDNYSEVEKWSRRINLPDGVDESKLSSVVDKDGKMIIQAPYHTNKRETSQNIHIEMAD